MASNVGNLDRAIRVTLGLGLVTLAFVGPATVWGWLGVIPLVTGIVGSCPLYQLIRFSTKPAGKAA